MGVELQKRRAKRTGSGGKEGEGATLRLVTSLVKAQLVFLVTGMVLVLLFCAIALRLTDTSSVTVPLSLLALALASIAGGVGAVRMSGDGLLSGFLSGGITMGLVWALSLLPLPGASLETGDRVLFYCLMPVLSLCGAVVGKKRKSTKHRRR